MNDSAVNIESPCDGLIYRTIPTFQEDKTYSRSDKEISYNPGMDPARELIRRKAKEKGFSWKYISEKVGRNPAYIQQFMERGVPRNLPEEIRPYVAELLSVDENDLRGSSFTKRQPLAAPIQNARVAGSVKIASTIPAYGQAMGGKDGQFVLKHGAGETSAFAPENRDVERP